MGMLISVNLPVLILQNTAPFIIWSLMSISQSHKAISVQTSGVPITLYRPCFLNVHSNYFLPGSHPPLGSTEKVILLLSVGSLFGHDLKHFTQQGGLDGSVTKHGIDSPEDCELHTMLPHSTHHCVMCPLYPSRHIELFPFFPQHAPCLNDENVRDPKFNSYKLLFIKLRNVSNSNTFAR